MVSFIMQVLIDLIEQKDIAALSRTMAFQKWDFLLKRLASFINILCRNLRRNMDSVKLISNYKINFPNGLLDFNFFEQEIAALSLVGLRPFTNGIKSLLALRLTSTSTYHVTLIHYIVKLNNSSGKRQPSHWSRTGLHQDYLD